MVLNLHTFQIQVGIHDKNLYTTAYDLSLLARYAMNIPKFMEIVKKTDYSLPPTVLHQKEDRTFHTSNLLLDNKEVDYYYEYATGLKTGFTSPAGDCIVASSKKDNLEFIVVCLHSNSFDNGLRKKFLDCKTLFDFAFDNYTSYYTNLQEPNNNSTISEETIDTSNALVPEVNVNTNSYKFLIKIVCIIIIVVLFIIGILVLVKTKSRPYKRKRRR